MSLERNEIMKIKEFGTITIKQSESGEPIIAIEKFHVEGSIDELREFALDYIEKAVKKYKGTAMKSEEVGVSVEPQMEIRGCF
jgi:hypothetical protein